MLYNDYSYSELQWTTATTTTTAQYDLQIQPTYLQVFLVLVFTQREPPLVLNDEFRSLDEYNSTRRNLPLPKEIQL